MNPAVLTLVNPSTPSATSCSSFFFFNDTATTEIYTLSLHDALPISRRGELHQPDRLLVHVDVARNIPTWTDRKSTRLNSSHLGISYAVFCLKKKKTHSDQRAPTGRYTQRGKHDRRSSTARRQPVCHA